MKEALFTARFGWIIRQEMEVIRSWSDPDLDAALRGEFLEVFRELAHSTFEVAAENAPAKDAAGELRDDLDAHGARQFARSMLAGLASDLKK